MTVVARCSFLALAVLLAGCGAAPVKPNPPAPAVAPPAQPVPPAAPAPAAGPPPDDDLNATVWQQTALEYRLVAQETFRAATAQLDRALRDPAWDALPKEDRDRPVRGLPPALIVDVDETVLDNTPYQVRLIRDRHEFDEFTWSKWVHEEAATAVPGALDFARAAQARGIKIYYLTNRAADLGDATFENLRKVGFPIADKSQFLGLGTLLPGCEQVGSDKNCRRRMVGRTHRVLLQLGDQLGDFTTIVANTPAGRVDAMKPYMDWIGQRWFVLPNPTYGSWEPALFNNDRSLPQQERRRRKIEALRAGP